MSCLSLLEFLSTRLLPHCERLWKGANAAWPPWSTRLWNNKGTKRGTTRAIRSIVKPSDQETANLTRPTADGARRRRPKITGEATLGRAGVELRALCTTQAERTRQQALLSTGLEKGRRPACPNELANPCDDRAYLRRLSLCLEAR